MKSLDFVIEIPRFGNYESLAPIFLDILGNLIIMDIEKGRCVPLETYGISKPKKLFGSGKQRFS